MDKQHTSLDVLRWHVDVGADETLAEDPVDWTAQLPEKKPHAPPQQNTQPPLQATEHLSHKAPSPLLTSSTPDLSAVRTLDQLREVLTQFEGCSLKKTAMNTVFSDGVPTARIMLIGEAPGEDEDRQGLPFVGASGQLLDRMFAFIGLTRQKNIYITNILPWRPPGNRSPTDAEIAACLPFVHKHIELIQPAVIIVLGGTAAKSLLAISDGITKIRGRWQEYAGPNGLKTPVWPMYHPAYLLRTPAQKKMVWRDLLTLQKWLFDKGILT